jgi:hypothetical protein
MKNHQTIKLKLDISIPDTLIDKVLSTLMEGFMSQALQGILKDKTTLDNIMNINPKEK